jgi:GT2 family glycosyltransferase
MGQSFEQPAPVALFVYNRPAHTQRTLDALAANEGAAQTVLHIYADGPKPWRTPDDRRAIEAVRELIRGENRFAAVKLHERDTNHGLAQSIIAGVSERTQTDGAVIVLEDDIVTGPYFLTFMNQALAQYQAKPEVMHIAA